MRSVLSWEVSVGLVRVDTHLFTSYLISNALEVYDVVILNAIDDGATKLSVDGAEGGVHESVLVSDGVEELQHHSIDVSVVVLHF